MSHSATHHARTLSDETAGYLYADHTIRSVNPAGRTATAAWVLARYARKPSTPYGRGFRLRLVEFTTPPRSQ